MEVRSWPGAWAAMEEGANPTPVRPTGGKDGAPPVLLWNEASLHRAEHNLSEEEEWDVQHVCKEPDVEEPTTWNHDEPESVCL